jgi:hypothetical protein
MRADNTAYLRAAARRRAEQTRKRAIKALRRLESSPAPITFDAVAREAGVSRSWLYTQHDLRVEIERLRRRHQPSTPSPIIPTRQRASDASLLARLHAATDRIRHLEQENRQLRHALAEALGEQRHAHTLGRASRHDTPGRTSSKLFGPC